MKSCTTHSTSRTSKLCFCPPKDQSNRLACTECSDSLPFSGASSIPPCRTLFPATPLRRPFFHPPSLHPAIYFLVYLLVLLFPDSYIILFWESYFLPFSVHVQTNVIYAAQRCHVIINHWHSSCQGMQLSLFQPLHHVVLSVNSSISQKHPAWFLYSEIDPFSSPPTSVLSNHSP